MFISFPSFSTRPTFCFPNSFEESITCNENEIPFSSVSSFEVQTHSYQIYLETLFRVEKNNFNLFLSGKVKINSPIDLHKILNVIQRENYYLENNSEKDKFKKYFFEGIRSLSQKDIRNILKHHPKLARLLSDRLDSLLDQQEIDPELLDSETHQLLIAEAKAQLNMNMGYQPIPAGGQNGAVFVMDAFAEEGCEKIAVFKPTNYFFDLFKWLKSFFGQARLLNRNQAKFEQESEVIAKDLAYSLGFQVTPESKMSTLGNKEGALLLFLGSDYKPAKQLIDKIKPPEQLSEFEVITLQKAFIFNFITGDLDAHDENWLIKYRLRGDNYIDILDVRFVDFGNAFPIDMPKHLGFGNQFAWGNLPVSELPFHPETLAFIRQMKEENLESFMTSVNKDFLLDSARKQLELRFKILKYYTGDDTELPIGYPRPQNSDERIRSPKDLAQLHYQEDYLNFPIDKIKAFPSSSSSYLVDFKDL